MKFWISLLTLMAISHGQGRPLTNEQAIEFASADRDSPGQTVAAYQGYFEVTENRQKNHSRTLKLHYVRFPSTSDNPGPPIVYLAGGPGGSGIATAKHRRYALFMALREVADVIALDQRGTGQSNDLPRCQSSQHVPQEQPINDQQYIALNQAAMTDCLAFWQQQGVDLKAYNTLESVHDLASLRQHLGAEKISLWGISYGSHLALAAIKYRPEMLHKVMIASVEGLAQTIKLPARTDAYFDRLQQYLNQQQTQAFDIQAMMQEVHAKLDQEPVVFEWQNESGQTVRYHLQSRDMRQMAAAMIADPARAQQMLQLYFAVQAGITTPLKSIVQQHMDPTEAIGFSAMSTAMDLASGIGTDRFKTVAQQAQSALLGTYLNFSYHFTDLAIKHGLDLGDDFRRLPHSDVPTLVISGTLDGRTYIESQLEATAGLRQRQTIQVVNAGHNLFKSSPLVIKNMLLFMRDLPLADPVITAQP
ncbi:alpha/beta fold hydrolase [Marinicella meishanensis]|uniref:alpha/beta fold hydrolase n=1 Tax=Marinicella meishanensis TaxID=2873263 RepID=UPI001CBC0772|nr:alpha/beta hydrolase [Marinicella sp. NBU2979]